MMPHKSWEIGGLAVLLLLYFYGVWSAFSKTQTQDGRGTIV